jgi:hypothetical protein
MLQRFLRRHDDDPYLALHTEGHAASVYDEAAPRSWLHNPRVRLLGGGALALTVAAALFSGGSKDGASIPVISPPTPTTRIKPADPQGMELPHKDIQVYGYVDPNGPRETKVERLIPAPQDTPKLPPKPVVAAVAAPVQAPIANPPVAALPNTPQVAVVGGQPAATPQPTPTIQPRATPQTVVQAPPTPLVVRSAPPPVVVAPSQTVTPPAPAAVVAPAPAAMPVTAPVASDGGTFRLQLGSLRDMAAAQQHWKTAQARSAGALAGLQPQILRVEIPGKGTYFRVQAGGWPTRQDAQQACERLKQARVDCMVVR